MMKLIFRKIMTLLKYVVLFAVFLALTYLLLEFVRYYQNKALDSSNKPTITEGMLANEKKANEDIIEATAVYYKGISQEEIDVVDTDVNAVVPTENDNPILEYEEEELKRDLEVYDDYSDLLEYLDVRESEDIVANNEVAEEETYKLYEEELPQNIIVENVPHNNIREIKVPTHKPPYLGGKPIIVIVIDDMGVNKKRTGDISSLKYPITSSFLTYSKDLKEQITVSVDSGQEVMAHIPMEANSKANAAPDVLKISMKTGDIINNLNEMLDKFGDIKGVNNHMGSKFTEDRTKMDDVMRILRGRNLFFLDSRTSNKSVGEDSADKYGVSYATRNIFLDNENDLNYVLRQLRATERVAQKKGYAIAIGHPKSQTYLALKQWLPNLEKRGFKLIHLSELVKLLND